MVIASFWRQFTMASQAKWLKSISRIGLDICDSWVHQSNWSLMRFIPLNHTFIKFYYKMSNFDIQYTISPTFSISHSKFLHYTAAIFDFTLAHLNSLPKTLAHRLLTRTQISNSMTNYDLPSVLHILAKPSYDPVANNVPSHWKVKRQTWNNGTHSSRSFMSF